MTKPAIILLMVASVGASVVVRGSGFVTPAIDRLNCEAGQTACDNMRQCISKDLFCNGFPDCDDGSDEKTRHCYYRFFRCENKLIRSYLLCDGNVDCPDGSDEVGCLTTPPEEPPTTTPTATEATTENETTVTANAHGATDGTTEHDVTSTQSSSTSDDDLLIESTTPASDSIVTSFVEESIDETTSTTILSTDPAVLSETATLLTMTTSSEKATLINNKPENVDSQEVQQEGYLIAGFSWWITLAIAFFAGLAIMLAAVTHLYIWIWKKSSAAKQPSARPDQYPDFKNDDLFTTYSFSSAGSTSRSIQSSDFYFINPSIVVVDSHH